MSFVESEEHQMLRKQVSEIGRKYGREYYAAKAREGLSPNELWDEVAKHGFIGVNTPEEYGGGGLGIYELTIVCEELAAAGCPLLLLLVSPAICATEDTDVVELSRILWGMRIHRIPILLDGRVTGVVTALDVVRAVAEGTLA